ncbi:Frizzled/smoothened-like sans CRD protein C [Gossypium arboreum]|uniref:Frizzled/smoothened-like sans CRD protein C n=1 Tax=Gossypium arboreum TaxID=29729 RepID=A0A0B0MYI0_GOSAR|nr:Frizzled/smoothened-like sans CRD protein C [Gossypium arboreum]KHG28263.1 Frizzled/smoothened-like sans CRD protein C [Gossypium arboreum]
MTVIPLYGKMTIMPLCSVCLMCLCFTYMIVLSMTLHTRNIHDMTYCMGLGF